jgi:hypothetical protein
MLSTMSAFAIPLRRARRAVEMLPCSRARGGRDALGRVDEIAALTSCPGVDDARHVRVVVLADEEAESKAVEFRECRHGASLALTGEHVFV